jgi:hypothetical protein
MLKLRSIVLTSLFTAVASMSWAAIPDFVGTFTGTAKLNSYAPDGSKSKVTVPITLEIAADDSTTFTIGGVSAFPSLVVYNGPNGFLIQAGGSGYQILTFQVKKTSIKGVIQQAVGSSLPTLIISDGKFKLKKSS